ncbi:hypothetical protein V8F33_013962 [Rhypophila sp. PSN 637]
MSDHIQHPATSRAMSVFKLALFLAILATTRVAMSQDDTAWVLVCEHAKWEGRCAFLRSRAGQCTNVPGDWNDIISLVRNDDADIFRCKWFEYVSHPGLNGLPAGRRASY